MFGCIRSSNFFGENITRLRARAGNPFTRKADCPMKSWIYLTFAILAEVVGTSCLKASQGFTKPIPSLVVVAGYGLAFYLLSLTLETIPVPEENGNVQEDAGGGLHLHDESRPGKERSTHVRLYMFFVTFECNLAQRYFLSLCSYSEK